MGERHRESNMSLARHVIRCGRNSEQERASRAGRRGKEHSSLGIDLLLRVYAEAQSNRAYLYVRVRIGNVGPEHKGKGCTEWSG